MRCCVESDYLVVGSGIAGLSFALRVAQHGTVIVVTKKKDLDTATNLAQGGIAAVLDSGDSFDSHIDDTLVSGDGLCDPAIVEMVIKNGKSRVTDLINYGVGFVRDERTGKLSLGREGGHGHRRVAHAYDLTGREIERALLAQVKDNPNIILLEDHVVVDLLVRDSNGARICVGAYVMLEEDKVVPFTAQVTVLCTGGAGKVYLYTTNPDIATGDGVAMASRAGASVTNMEFVQFHPTCLFHPLAKNFLISEAVRGEGAILVTAEGQRFMEKYDSRKELATRDKVARSIDQIMKESGNDCVYLDISHKDSRFIQKRFPAIYGKCLEYGIDITKDPIPVVPAAHYLCGGVLVDTWGNTTIAGLMALGETSCTGLHGANRLASNSLLEAVVFAEKAAEYCQQSRAGGLSQENVFDVDSWHYGEANRLEEAVLISHNWDLIRRVMWNYVGIVRTVKRLKLAKTRLTDISEEIEEHYRAYYVSDHMVELRNISHVSLMIVECALMRKESRGLHYCLDYRKRKDGDRYWQTLRRLPNGSPWQFHGEKLRFENNIK
ncbi:MAG: L-aspartate oxidase [Desulfobacterales bacterium]|nr:L-aspartate oxidase [Desulfobacterales bacterium]